MTNQLRYELEKFEEEELIQRIAKKWFTEKAKCIVIEILEERGCENIPGKIQEAEARLVVTEKLREDKDKQLRNFLILQALILFLILPTIFFPIGENPTPPLVMFIVMELLVLPIGIGILRGLNKKNIGILILMIIIIPFLGWMIAIIYSIKKSA